MRNTSKLTINPDGKFAIYLDSIAEYEPAFSLGINTLVYAIVDQETGAFATVTVTVVDN